MTEETDGTTATLEPTQRKAPTRRRRTGAGLEDGGATLEAGADTPAGAADSAPEHSAVESPEVTPAAETPAVSPAAPGGRSAARRGARARKPLQVDEVRRVGEKVKIRRGELWYNVVPQGDGPKFEERGELVFLLGQYRLVRTEASRIQQSVVEGEGDLPEDAVRSPRAWLRQAKSRRRVFKVRPFGLERVRMGEGEAEPTLVCQIGSYRGLLPARLADANAPGPERTLAIMEGWLNSALPLVVMVEHIDDDQQIVVLSRKAAREFLSRHRLDVGARAQMVVRQVFPDRLVGDIGAGADAWLFVGEWDGLPHADLRKLAQPGDSFEVEVLRGGADGYTVSRQRVVGDQWASRTQAYRKFGVYRGTVGARTASGEQWHVSLAEGIDAVCTAPLWMDADLAAGRPVNVRITERDGERRLLYGAIQPAR